MILLSKLLWFFLSFLAAQALGQAQSSSKPFSNSITLSYEVLGSKASAVTPFATVEYDPKTLNYVLASWDPPDLDSLKSTSKEATSASLLRIVLPGGSTTITSLNTFDTRLSQDVNIWISQDTGEVLSASVTSITPPPLSKEEELQRQKEERLRKRGKAVPSTKPKPKPKSKKAKDKIVENVQTGPVVQVNLLVAGQGVKPQLTSRKPVQVDADGREIIVEEQPEKTFFQKYWLALLGVGFILMTSLGGGDK